MALTFKIIADSRVHLGMSVIQQPAVLTPAASDYPTGGYPMYSSSGSAPDNAGQPFGLGNLTGLVVQGYTGTAIGYEWRYNRTTCKLQVFGIAVATAGATIYALTEVAANTDLSGGTVKVSAVGY